MKIIVNLKTGNGCENLWSANDKSSLKDTKNIAVDIKNHKMVEEWNKKMFI